MSMPPHLAIPGLLLSHFSSDGPWLTVPPSPWCTLPMWRDAGIHEAFFEPTSVTWTTMSGVAAANASETLARLPESSGLKAGERFISESGVSASISRS